MDTRLRGALAASHLGGLPAGVRDRLLVGARSVVVPAGSVVHREGDQRPHLELVVSGVLRILVSAPDGRTMTVRYCRPGALLGAMSFFRSGFSMPATAQALTEVRMLRADPDVVASMTREPDVAHALLVELSERAEGFLNEIPGGAFATVRQRVARHLLDLAAVASADGAELVVTASQQELADAAGTVREVVVRVLRELRTEGLVRTERGQVVLLDVDRLVEEEVWNLSS
jgi:CRP/FNR family cyclic AMP-dependent transcriptional regulator